MLRRVRRTVTAPFRPKPAGPRLLRAFADVYPEAFFIEVGANDGEQHDLLRPLVSTSRWRGIMVEPVPYVFTRLRALYGGDDRIALADVAISDRAGIVPFHHLDEASGADRERLPGWYDAIGSLSAETVLRHARQIPDIERRLVRRDVQALTFEGLCERFSVGRLDLVLVDTEGSDARVLAGLDLDRRRPRLIVYEHYHLDAAERAASRARLERYDYEVMEEGFDSFCLDTRVDDSLTALFRALRPVSPGLSDAEERL